MAKNSRVNYERVITIRSAVKDDIYYGLLDCFQAFGPTVDAVKAENQFESRLSQSIKTFVACEDDQKVLGTISLILKPSFNHNGKSAAIIEDVITNPSYRNLGIASLLVKHAISYCRQRDCYKVILNCKKELEPFYEKFGFTVNENELRLNL